MVELNKGTVIFKHFPSDFIVEEVREDKICKISDTIEVFNDSKVSLGSLDINDRRTFLSFDLEKIDIDHFTAMTILGKCIGSMAHEIGYAGSKDKKAWTCQRISIFNPNIDKIKSFSHVNILLKDFRWIRHKIKIGDLKGNRFTIILRDADKDAIKILNRIRNAEKVPNYFGNQRFGSLRGDNVKIGKLILKRKFQEAVYAFLTGYGEKESDEIKTAKKKLKTEKNIEEAIKYFPTELYTEKRILNYLPQNSGNWIGALNLIGEKTLLMMVQSVQSAIFNDILQRVVEESIEIKQLDLIGYDSKASPGRLGRIEDEVLENHNLKPEDFMIDEIKFLSLSKSSRKAYFNIHDLSIETVNDEVFTGSKKIKMIFTLDSGNYATTLLEQFFILRE